MMFNDRERAVVTTQIFRMPVKQALPWIEKNHGYSMSEPTYYRLVSKIESDTHKRQNKFILEGILKKQIDAIDRLETLIRLSFVNAEKCITAEKYRDAQFVYNSIARQQEILTSYYDEIQGIIEYDVDQEKKMESSREAQSEQNINGFFESGKGRSSRHLTAN